MATTNTNTPKFYSPRYDEYLTKQEFNLLQSTDRRNDNDSAASCNYILRQIDNTDKDNSSVHYALINSKGCKSSDLKNITHACQNDPDAVAFINAHSFLWEDKQETKPAVNKMGRFVRTSKGNIKIVKIKAKPITDTVVYMPIKSEDQFFVPHANMGSLRDAKVTRWANLVIAKIRSGEIKDGSWLYNHTTQIMAKAPYGLRGRTRDLISQIWFTWKTRKACIAVANALRSLSK